MTDQIKIDKRLIEKSPGSFIFEFDNEIPLEKCDEIVQRFEESKDDQLVIFPPFWTHEHRGVTVKKGSKYIATTWIVFK